MYVLSRALMLQDSKLNYVTGYRTSTLQTYIPSWRSNTTSLLVFSFVLHSRDWVTCQSHVTINFSIRWSGIHLS